MPASANQNQAVLYYVHSQPTKAGMLTGSTHHAHRKYSALVRGTPCELYTAFAEFTTETKYS